MALAIKYDNTVKYPVSILVPNADGSESTKTVTAIFSSAHNEQITLIGEDAYRKKASGDDISKEKIHLLKEVLCGWEGIKIGVEDGPDLPFNEETFSAVMSIPYLRDGFVSAYIRMRCERAGHPVGEAL